MHVRYAARCLLTVTILVVARSHAIGDIITERRSDAQLHALTPLTTPAPRSPEDGQGLEINGLAGPELGGTMWGTHAGQGEHAFGGTSIFADINAPGLTLTITTESIPPPAGKKFAGIITIDFSNFDPVAYSVHEIDILGIKEQSEPNFINSIELIGEGFVETDGSNIFWTGSGIGLDTNPIIVIKWTQVPSPGAPLLVSVAIYLVGARRRRHESCT